MLKLISSPARLWLATRPLRWEAVRHSRAGYGPFVTRPLDAALTQRWVTPLLTNAGVRTDTARFLRGIRPADLLDVSTRLGRFTRPVLLVWGTGDRFFTLPLARRLAAAFPDARLVEVEGGHTFLPLDEPGRIRPARSAASSSPPDPRDRAGAGRASGVDLGPPRMWGPALWRALASPGRMMPGSCKSTRSLTPIYWVRPTIGSLRK